MVPGEIAELSFALEPTSFLFREGHRIRIAIAGADAAVFRRIPDVGTPTLKVQRNSLYPSSLELPVVAGSS
jgi:predicted acyl esterase